MSTTKTDMDRAQRTADLLDDAGADALLVTGPVNVRWLTGFTGSSGSAVIGAGDLRAFLTDFRYLTQSAEQLDAGWDRRIVPDLAAAVPPLLDGVTRLGFDDAAVTVKEHARLQELVGDDVELVPCAGLVEGLRAVKDDAEKGRLKAAALLADAALTEVIGRGLVGRTERDVGLDLEFTMRKMGAEAVSFSPIIAAGPHGALPHASPRDVEIPAGTLVVIDWGAQLDGYASDCTRTYATGELDPRDREIYDLVLEAQLAALAAVKPGPTGKEVDAVARGIIDGAGHAEHFGHGLGHGVGMEVHEGPRLSKLGTVALVPGHVVTVEPGVYVPGAVGVRIEDLVIVTEDGHEVLNGLTKDLTVVG
ncbi:Aminopeptidase YpdF [Paraconexibacter sp. AEG42_29]|uniref:Aminopeptidase YpdF n=1 Tax=Paraconexibacter sp. AEG42_29 TaxID=2997339 RepID=A0AAU7AXL4_9ACTN